ncbi:hypothetical protein P8C59_001029 [Phyllachora maydis]|uniref:GEgh 16 protein n=1 Tax=Phyllachora maydis TaxID=1825666 RepID=A0AAD9HXK1_9PEZI|nr:hypothetical protein P8C59_001029 [Phyllachora maydis]
MYSINLILALSAASAVNAHMKVTLANGNLGGSMPALAIQDGVPRFGKNDATEVDTTVFGGNPTKPTSSGLGKTNAQGKITVDNMLKAAMAMGGGTIPTVSSTGGHVNGTIRVVTSDGAPNNEKGEVFAVIDTTGQGNFKDSAVLMAQTNGVGKKGNVVQRSLFRAYILTLRTLGIRRRATNVGADLSFSVKIPDGTTCTGTDAKSGASNFCVLKIANDNAAGPFGGSVVFAVSNGGTSGATSPTTGGGAQTRRRRADFKA